MRNKKQIFARALATAMSCIMPFTTSFGAAGTITAFADDSQSQQTEYVYGTVNLPYADYYYGELNDVKESATMELDATDKASSLREKGMYDAVSSATTSKYKNFATTYYTENEDATTGGTIEGIKDVNIAVPKSLYDSAKDAIEKNSTCNNSLLKIVEAMNVTDTVPNEYKVLNGDGTLTETKDSVEAKVATGVNVSITNDTPWGQYQISVEDSTDNPTLPDKEAMEGVVIETSDGAKYGMKHLENLWFRTGKIAFAVTEGFKEPHGNTLTAARYADIAGKKITKITYIVRGGADVVYNTDLLCKKLLDESAGYGYTGEGTVYADGATVTMTGKTPEGTNYSLSSVEYGNKTLTAGTDYTYENNVLTVKATENTGVGNYTLTYSDKDYQDIYATVLLSSSMKSDEVSIADNTLSITNKDVTVQNYLAAVDSVKINGKALNGRNLGTTVFNADGTVNFDAVINMRGNKTVVFPNDGETYTIEVTATGYPSVSGSVTKPVAAVQYVYAGLTWAEYWANENVYLADGIAADASSDKADSRGEYDKGAFDVVTRATTNHGLHRGSYQCMATIYDTDGKAYEVSSWNSASEAVLTNSQVITFERGAITYTDAEGSEKTAQMDHYEVSGIKYVPVAVKTEDFEAFCQKYPVVKKGEKISGGFSEANLVAYSAEAEVTADTNGLKTATKNEDGTFSFSARQNGTGSGIAGASLKKAENITVTVKEANGSYGEFLRVDLTGDGYGDLGANMQAVVWKYYGNDSEYKNALVTYGTKFAADNWMHKAMGVQLGLTDSLRCKLPEGTDGTGYWTLTVCALGHEDYTTQFEVKAENIVEPTVEKADTTALEEAIAAAKALVETDYTPESWASMLVELGEAEDELAAPHTQATVDEAVEHLNAAVAALEKKPVEPVITSIKNMDITLSATKFYYDGKSKKPEVKVGELEKDKDFTVSYKNNKNIGKATVTIKGIGNYTGTVKKTFNIGVKKNAAYTVGSLTYKITNTSVSGKGTVEVSATNSKTLKSVKIASTVKIGGVSFNVTSIGKNAFRNCKNLKVITVSSTKIKTVGTNAFKGIYKKAKIKVPSSKLKSYKKLFAGKGQSKTVTITK